MYENAKSIVRFVKRKSRDKRKLGRQRFTSHICDSMSLSSSNLEFAVHDARDLIEVGVKGEDFEVSGFC